MKSLAQTLRNNFRELCFVSNVSNGVDLVTASENTAKVEEIVPVSLEAPGGVVVKCGLTDSADSTDYRFFGKI